MFKRNYVDMKTNSYVETPKGNIIITTPVETTFVLSYLEMLNFIYL